MIDLSHMKHSAMQTIQDWLMYFMHWLRDFILPELNKSIVVIEEVYENVRETIQSSFIGRVLSIPLPILTALYLILNDRSKQLIGLCILLWYYFIE
jgi:ABC-type phosphate/phosphonate transport system permease subunit